MIRQSNKKQKLFDLYEEMFSSKNGVGLLNLCRECKASCEKGPDVVVLLPFESQFIKHKLRQSRNEKTSPSKIREIECVTGCCPFFQDEKCSIHSFRPIDCRTYPLTPIFKKNSFELKLLRGCPYRDNIPRSFLNQISSVWQRLLPLLSSTWKKRYNHVVSSLPLKDLPPYLAK